jgi:PAS domain S-box-containing protein
MATQLPAVLESLGVIAVVVDLGGAVLAWTDRFRELAGQAADDLRGCPLWEFASPNDRDRMRRAMVNTANDRHTSRVDALMSTSSGPRRVAWSFSCVSLAGDECIVAWGTDVNATVESTVGTFTKLPSEFSASEQELAAIYGHAPTIIFYVAIEANGDFRFLSMSRVGLATMGLTREQVVGVLVRDVIPPPSRDLVLNNYREAVRTGQTVRWKEVSVYPSGRKVGEVAATPLYDANGRATHLIGIVNDITERERLEEALQALRDEAHNRELKLLLETAVEGVVSVDATGTIVTANRALEAMFGWPSGELIGQSLEVLVPSSRRHAHVPHRTDYFVAPQSRQLSGRHLVGQRKDGSTFPIEVRLNHVGTPGGGSAFAFVTDITERQARTAELEHRTAQLSRLASDLTLAEHHAREEVAKILHDGLQQLLVSAALNLDRRIRRDEQRAVGTDDLLKHVKVYLDEAIAAARSLSVELFPPVLHSLGLPAALSWLAEQTRSKYGLEVEVHADPRANSERKDVRALLFESVRELLFNAVKHAKIDRVTVDLVLDPEDVLCITVEDRGIGFDPAALAERAKAGQVGWGLFSIRERLRLLGGRFEIDSTPGQGTRFRVIAPRGTTPGAVGEQAALPTRDRGPSVPLVVPTRFLTILIVDDHIAVRTVIREFLQERAELCVVGDAANGLEAIAQARALQPDVILMDISMPEMDGVEATRRIRAELPGIEILGLSSQARTQAPTAIERAGAAAYFLKGTETQRLIDHLLALHRALIAPQPGNRS